MPTFPDKSQRPQQQAGSVCAKCGGTGRVQVVVKGNPTSQPCIACRGTGQGGRGYGTK
jgi:DnaJ-class molecular chaperone